MKKICDELDLEKQEQIERGKRIKFIRENELHLNKTQKNNTRKRNSKQIKCCLTNNSEHGRNL